MTMFASVGFRLLTAAAIAKRASGGLRIGT
jgi:hypothetical protein